MVFIKLDNNNWWELNKEKLEVINYNGGSHSIKIEQLETCETLELENWHELYKATDYCPLEVSIRWSDVWISPDGTYYNGNDHDNRAEEILEIIYNGTDIDWFGDRLEQLGWIRATRSLMWEVRLGSDYWDNRALTQKQYDALYDWCKYHNKRFPSNIDIKYNS